MWIVERVFPPGMTWARSCVQAPRLRVALDVAGLGRGEPLDEIGACDGAHG